MKHPHLIVNQAKGILNIALFFIFILIISLVYINRNANYQAKDLKLTIKNMWGQPAKMMFPDIADPKYVIASEANMFLKDSDDVFFFQNKDKIYVFPINIMAYHHIVNGYMDNNPVAVTYCLLSNTAAVYSRFIDGKTTEFGVLGPLYYGNLVIYNKINDSYWTQMTGEAFYGKYKENKLNSVVPVEFSKWDLIKNRENVFVLSPINDISFYSKFYEDRKRTPIGINSLPKGTKIDNRYNSFETGLGINNNGKSLFVSLPEIKKTGVFNTSIENLNLIVLFDDNNRSFKIFDRKVKNHVLKFELMDGLLMDDETRSVWDGSGLAISGPLKDERLKSPFYVQAYWYSWSSFFPKTRTLSDLKINLFDAGILDIK